MQSLKFRDWLQKLKTTWAKKTMKYIKIITIGGKRHDNRNCYLHALQTWQDRFLMWSPSQYGNLTRINLPVDAIWTPSVGLLNSWVKTLVIKSTLLHCPSSRASGKLKLNTILCWFLLVHFGSIAVVFTHLSNDLFTGLSQVLPRFLRVLTVVWAP